MLLYQQNSKAKQKSLCGRIHIHLPFEPYSKNLIDTDFFKNINTI